MGVSTNAHSNMWMGVYTHTHQYFTLSPSSHSTLRASRTITGLFLEVCYVIVDGFLDSNYVEICGK